MRRQGGYPKPQLTGAQSMVQLKTFLASCTDEKLAELTVDTLAPRFKVDRRMLECTLLACQDTRRRFLAKQEISA
jgi:hypothetical protein